MKTLRHILLLAALACLAAGCATTDPDAESDIPWNMTQPWEMSPSMPYLNNY